MAKPQTLDIDARWQAIAARSSQKRIPALLSYIRERREFQGRWECALRDARVPLAFAWGLRDPISGEHMLDWVRRLRPDAQVLELPTAGHYPQVEEEARVADFVKRVTQLAQNADMSPT